MIKNSQNKNEIILLKEIFQKTGLHAPFLLIPATLLSLTAVFEGISMAMLIPLTTGIMTRNFDMSGGIFHWIKGAHLVFMENSPGKATFIFLTLFIFFSILLKNIFQYVALVLSDRFGMLFMEKVRGIIFRRYLSFGKQFFDQQNVGRLVDINLGITRHIQSILTDISRDFSLILIIGAYLIVMFFISWQLTLLSLFLFPTLYYVSDRLIHKIRESSKRESKSKIQLASLVSNAISRIVLIKAYCQEEKESESVEALARRTSTLEESVVKKQRLVPAIQEMLVIFGSLILVSIAAIFFKNTEKVAQLLVFFIVLRRMGNCLLSIERIRGSLASIGGAIKEVAWVLEDEDKAFVSDGAVIFKGLRETIEFCHLTYAYQKDVKVLKDINFRIDKGKTTAIVGKTGSGKTTIAQLLMRFYECDPKMILVDGVDIKAFHIASLRASIAFVPQEPILFNDTLRNNLIYGLNKDISSEELEKILKKARLDDYVRSLPQGLETLIGDRGVQLSGGEKQRVAIARAILKNAEILILDEATSALDSKTEKHIQEAIKEVVQGRTSIIIAHRLSTIKHADKIVVIEEGRVVEEGTLETLLSKKEKFFCYWEEQRTVA